MIAGYTTEEFAVPFPKLSDEQVEWFSQQVLAYIDRQRQTYRDRAGSALGHDPTGDYAPLLSGVSIELHASRDALNSFLTALTQMKAKW
jgi:hypothetical protein